VDWSEFDTPLDPDPLFWIEPKDKGTQKEDARVAAFRSALKKKAPHMRAVAVPNAGKRGWKAINQAKKEGMSSGFPDLIILGGNRIAFLEFKAAKTMPTSNQVFWMNWMIEQGYAVACVRSKEAAIAFLEREGVL